MSMYVSPHNSTTQVSNRVLFALCFAFVGFVSAIGFWYQAHQVEFLPLNPTGEIARTTVALSHGEWANRPYYVSLARELLEQSKKYPDAFLWQDVFTQDVFGRFVPKHCIFLSALALPFFLIFGVPGFWILNQGILFLAFTGVYLLAREFSSRVGAVCAVFLSAIGTSLFYFSYSVSYDVFGAALIALSLANIQKGKSWIPGILLALSFACRVSNLFFLPLILILLGKPSYRTLKFLLGVFLAWSPLLIFQWAVWGAPLAGPYARLVAFQGGQLTFDTASHFFSLQTLRSEGYGRLFQGSSAVVKLNPVLWLCPLGVLSLVFISPRREVSTMLLAAFAYATLMLSYSQWAESGARFLLPSVLIIVALMPKLVSELRLRLLGTR